MIPADVRYYQLPSAVTISTAIHGMLNHSHRQLLLSILINHKIHACHSLQIGAFRWWNSRQLLRNRDVNISAVSESRHLGLIPTDIIVTDYAQWCVSPRVNLELVRAMICQPFTGKQNHQIWTRCAKHLGWDPYCFGDSLTLNFKVKFKLKVKSSTILCLYMR